MKIQKKDDKLMIVVPSRKGSRRLPGKNNMRIRGRTLVEHAIRRACLTKKGDVFFVTDDMVAREYMKAKIGEGGALYNFIDLPDDIAQGRAVRAVHHAIETMEALGVKYTSVMVTLPTSPLCSASDLCAAYEDYLTSKIQCLMSVTLKQGNIMLAMNVVDGQLLPQFGEESWAERMTFFPNYYKSNGAVWICDIEQFMSFPEWYQPMMIPYIMPQDRGMDIDTDIDFFLAEKIAERMGKL